MARRLINALAFAIILAAAAGIGRSPVARAAAVCDGSAYDTLCAGGHLNVYGYLSSPNGRYRFVYQPDGHTLIYDTQDWNNWDPSSPVFEPHPNPSYLMYGVGPGGRATTEISLWSFTSSGASALPYYISWGQAQNDSHYMRLENDGCLRAYQSDGSFIMTLWC
jgi:hypothetical protein